MERAGESRPFKEEDWLRYLLPSLFHAGEGPTMMVTGPSLAREAFVLDDLERAFSGWSVSQGAVSLGTFEDVLTSLDYIERVYGPAVLPNTLVLGISYRFVSELPSDRPFSLGLNEYSPHFRVQEAGDGSLSLERKSPGEGLAARWAFLRGKQGERYRALTLAVVGHWMTDGLDRFLQRRRLSSLLRDGPLGRLLGVDWVFQRGPNLIVQDRLSPYKYRIMQPWSHESIRDHLTSTSSYWPEVLAWDPRTSRGRVLERFRELRRFSESHGIELFVVNLPQNSVFREAYVPEYYSAYREIVREGVRGLPFLDLFEAYPDEYSYDGQHVTGAGAAAVTSEVIRLIAGSREGPATDGA